MVYPVFTSVPTGNYGWTKNLILCVDLNSGKLDMNYFHKKVYSDYSGQWVITYHEKYKVLTNKESDVKYLPCQCVTEPP